MAKTGQQSTGAQSAALELKEKHEKYLRDSEALIERDETTRAALATAKTNAETAFQTHPTKNNYKRMKTAAMRCI